MILYLHQVLILPIDYISDEVTTPEISFLLGRNPQTYFFQNFILLAGGAS